MIVNENEQKLNALMIFVCIFFRRVGISSKSRRSSLSNPAVLMSPRIPSSLTSTSPICRGSSVYPESTPSRASTPSDEIDEGRYREEPEERSALNPDI